VIEQKATSYVLNDIVFDPGEFGERYNQVQRIPFPSRTALMFILSADRKPGKTWDHAHCAEWTSWSAILADIEPDRHRSGGRAPNRLKGSSNYLYADGHVANLSAREIKEMADAGINPGAVPKSL
jgi:prepilin-type processing-associated H-X9-DG protein